MGKTNWRIQKVVGKKESELHWLHWWAIVDLERLKAEIERLIQVKNDTGDYCLPGTSATVKDN